MTGPMDWGALYGVGSPQYQGELSAFNASRDDLLSKLFGIRAGAPQQIAQQGRPQQSQQPLQTWHDEDLVGAATYWGIPEAAARAMPRDQLIDIVNQKRQVGGRSAGVEGMQMLSDPRSWIAALAPTEMFALGAGEAITGGLQHLPLVGSWLGKLGIVHDADLKLRQMEEAVRSTIPGEMQWAASGANIAGNIAAMWTPATATWAISGKVGEALPLVSRFSPLGKAAFQGGLSSYLLEGGSEQFQEHPGLSLAGGAALGSAVEFATPYLIALATKITKRFVAPELLTPTDYRAGAGGPRPTASAEDQLQQLAAQGDEQAKTFLDVMGKSGSAGSLSAQPIMMTPEQVSHEMVSRLYGENQAETLATQMNKAATIVQSPVFPELAGATQVDELSVAKAAIASNPGGDNIVQGVANPSEFISQLGTNVRFASRGDRLDALISDLPVTDKMVSQYEKHGVFAGQHVLTPDGVGQRIKSIDATGRATVEAWYTGDTRRVSVKDLHPMTTSPGSIEAAPIWNEFTNYVDQRVGETANAMGGVLSQEQLSSVQRSGLPGYMEDFFQAAKIDNAADQARLRTYFNQRYVQSFQPAAPVEVAQQQAAVAHYGAVAEVAEAAQPPVQALDQAAAVKGFVAIPNAKGGWYLQDIVNARPAASMEFQTPEATLAWLRTLNRDLPDISPPSDTPIELASMLPRESLQQSNINAGRGDALVNTAVELAAGGAPPDIPGVATALAGEGRFGQLENLLESSTMDWSFQRQVAADLDNAIHGAGVQGISPASTHSRLTQLVNQRHNAAHPLLNELHDALAIVKTRHLVDGSWSTLYSIPDLAAREAAARAAGFGEKELQSFGMFDSFLQQMYGDTGSAAAGELRQLLPQLAQKQSVANLPIPAPEIAANHPELKNFLDFTNDWTLNYREMDPRVLGNALVKSHTWSTVMEPHYSEMVQQWQAVRAGMPELGQAADVVGGWLNMAKYGYRAEDDIAFSALHKIAQGVLGSDLTRDQSRHLFSLGMNSIHQALLGFQTHVMARDALQGFFVLPRLRGDFVAALRDFATSSESRSRIMQQAVDDGIAQLHMPRTSETGFTAGELQQAIIQGASSEVGVRMRMAANIAATVRDYLPSGLRDTRDTMLNPLYLYGKQTEVLQAITAEAARNRAGRALGAFRNDPTAPGAFDTLLGESAVKTLNPAYQRAFEQLVAAGDDRAAATFVAKQITEATNFVYGTLQSPKVSRTFTGKIGMQMGSFALQTVQLLKDGVQYGTTADKVAFLATLGGVSAGLAAASAETGWNFNKMNPFYGLGFFGGPLLFAGTDILQGLSSNFNQLQGGAGNPQADYGMTRAAGDVVSMFNPARGLMRTAEGIGSAMQSPYPGRAIARLGITGEIGNGPDVEQWMLPQANASFLQSLQPMNDPVRSGSIGTSQIPQQQPTYPPSMSFPSQVPGYSSQGQITTVPNPQGHQFQNNPVQGLDLEQLLPSSQRTPADQQFIQTLIGLPPNVAGAAVQSYLQSKGSGGPPIGNRTAPSLGGGAFF